MKIFSNPIIKNKQKIILWLIIVLFFSLALYNASLIRYGIDQAKGQIKIIRGSTPISSVLIDNLIAVEKRQKLINVQSMLDFAYKQGLRDNGNYRAFYDQKGQPILWNVSASLPFEFIPVAWHFPVLGKFSYKGFFELSKAEKEAETWKLKNYDVRIRPASAWSTLGWFNDPILSGMLNRSEGELAELIFHELTHGTVFLKNQLQLNENLASFVGEKMAVKYLQEKYGPNSFEINQYIKNQNEDALFRNHMLVGKDTLSLLYQSWKGLTLTDEQKHLLKNQLITEIIERLDTVIYDATALKSYQEFLLKNIPNNAYFMSFQRYYDNQAELALIFDLYNQSIPDFLQHIQINGLKTN